VIAINKIHIQPIYSSSSYVCEPSHSAYLRDGPSSRQCHDIAVASGPCSFVDYLVSNTVDSYPGSSRTPSDDGTGSEGHMRRIAVSPTASSRTSASDTHNYSDEDSISDIAEAEAALVMIDNELANTEDAPTNGALVNQMYQVLRVILVDRLHQ
jgi:hypothetical protein